MFCSRHVLSRSPPVSQPRVCDHPEEPALLFNKPDARRCSGASALG